MAQLNPLRPITQRLNTTPVAELPRYAGFLATAILSCTELLRVPDGQQQDASVQVHKLITRISSLLQDKTQEGRFTGIVLVKAVIEAVGPQNLAKHGSVWLRNLLSCLNKNDPPQVKKLAVIATTRLFLLTSDSQTMVREITTPSLPAFLNACLSLIKPAIISKDGVDRQIQSSMLRPVLDCWNQLIKVFPSTFRPYVTAIRTIVLSLISQHATSHEVKVLAFRVYAALHFCAPKDTSASEWLQSVRLVIQAAHQTADLIFRSVIEDWTLVVPRQKPSVTGKKVAQEVQAPGPDATGLDKWIGVQAGCDRAVNLLQLLDTMLSSQHAQAVQIPLAEVFDLTARYASVIAPSKKYSLGEHKEIAREERDEMHMNLPRMYQAVLQLHEHLGLVLGQALRPVSQPILSQLSDLLEYGTANDAVRTRVYQTMKQLLQSNVLTLRSSDSDYIGNLTRKCIMDLQTSYVKHDDPHARKEGQTGTLNIDLHRQPKAEIVRGKLESDIAKAAWALLPVMLSHVPSILFSSKLRAEIDRFAILRGHEEALLASVMNPPQPRKGALRAPSVLPFLARQRNGEPAIEALMQPRMPVLQEVEKQGVSDISDEGEEHQNEDSTLPDAHLNTVEDQIITQLNDDPILDTSESSPAKKREHAAIEEDMASTVPDPAKRTRLIPQEDHNDLPRDVLETPGRQVFGTQEQTLIGTAEHAQKETLAMNTHRTEDAPTIVDPTPPLNTSKQRTLDVEDDSDDSDIPKIDATLSSDEDEDEEEEEAV